MDNKTRFILSKIVRNYTRGLVTLECTEMQLQNVAYEKNLNLSAEELFNIGKNYKPIGFNCK